MINLPINKVIPQVKQTLLSFNRLVLQAPPGAGKTTALPLSLLDEPWLKDKKIIMLEPRRLAVRSSAARMAELLGENVGERVGYQIKMESLQSKKTKILIVTEGILTRKLQADPSLEDIALIIFDEFHERTLHADLSLALALESQSVLREDLKIVVMSATLNTSAISSLLDDAPITQSEGRAYPVEEIYLNAKTPQPTKKELPLFAYTLLQKILKEEKGNILIFLPGIREIKMVEGKLKESLPKDVYVSPLYGNLSKEEQDRAIKAPPEGSRKIVLSTNIAQTSLTIDGIKIVVDAGLQNSSVFNSSSGMNRLETSFISKDSATQRAGRAGRLSEGKAYHLWHKGKILLQHDTPEVLSADLTQMLLELSLWGNDDITTLSWMDIPPPSAIMHAKELLFQLGAIDKKGLITKHGKKMTSFALHPRLAHMMIKAKEMDLSYEASLLCVLISEKDIYNTSLRSSDMQERVSLLHDIHRGVSVNTNNIDIKQCKFLLQSAKKIEKRQKEVIDLKMLGVLLSFSYPDRIAQRRTPTSNSYLLSNAKGAFLHKEDDLFHAPYLVVSDLDARKQNALIYKAVPLSHAQIEEHLGNLLEEKEQVTWNIEAKRVEARKITTLGALVLKETGVEHVSSTEVSTVLISAIQELGLGVLSWNRESLRLRERINFVNAHKAMLGKSIFPDFSDETLLKTMHEWLLPYVNGLSTLKSCQSLDLHAILSGLISYEQKQALNALAPSRIKVASGSNIYLDYENAEQPILAVRLQEMFGTKSTPTVLNGKIKLMIHLLSPASRPMQVTQDLENFWKNTYDEVKKELRGKYKKHYWPDDPLTAQATNKTKKRM